MFDICEYGSDVIVGLDNYILCSTTMEPCYFYQYCPTKERMVNTEGAKTCKIRTKNKKTKEDILIKAQDNKKGIVTLVTNTYVIYEYDGNSCYKTGRFNLKVGDEIEV